MSKHKRGKPSRMRTKPYTIHTMGSQKDKLYKYKMKWVFGVNVEDLAQLLGIDAAVKLLHYYGGMSMYIPKIETVQRRIMAAMLRDDYADLINKGASSSEAITWLSGHYGMHPNRIASKVKPNRWPEASKAEQEEYLKLETEMDRGLLGLVEKYADVFKRFNII